MIFHIFLFLDNFSQLFVIIFVELNNNSCFFLFCLMFFNFFIGRVINLDNLESIRLKRLFIYSFGDNKYKLGDLLLGIWDKSIHKLIIGPTDTSWQRSIQALPNLISNRPCWFRHSLEIGRNYFIDTFLFLFHSSIHNFPLLLWLDDLCLLVEEVSIIRWYSLMLFTKIYFKHFTIFLRVHLLKKKVIYIFFASLFCIMMYVKGYAIIILFIFFYGGSVHF